MDTGQSLLAGQWKAQGAALEKEGKLREAIDAYLQSLRLHPSEPYTFLELGNLLNRCGNCDDAVIAYQRALALQPQLADAWTNLAVVLRAKNRGAEAIEALRRAMTLQPDDPDAIINLAVCFNEAGALDEAEALLTKALTLQPNSARAILNIGYIRQHQGRLDEAIESYRRAWGLDPGSPAAHNLLWLIHFHPNYGPKQIFEEHERWYLQLVRRSTPPPLPHDNEHSPDRGSTSSPQGRLRIGYVSPDFCHHPVGLFMLPLMEHHDHAGFEIFCYSDLLAEDAVTSRIRSFADTWRATAALSDVQLAELVRSDRIDILVDLTMHLKGSRLLAFARKPAPVQVTYLAYCSTTGLEQMDYRLSDPYLDPPWTPSTSSGRASSGQAPGADESVYCERTVRLPRTYWCYPGPLESADIQPPPACRNGYITFGCLNSYWKVTNKTFDLWCDLLIQVPDSRLILYAHPGSHRQSASARMRQKRLDPGRLSFHSLAPTEEYLKRYNQIDIALDPFPYGGGTTTCDALWMGVPVVSMRGETCVSRGGLSILSNLGHPEWVAASEQEYLSIAITLTKDLAKLESLRLSLREKLKASPLMDAPQFARDVEKAYRQMWQCWCGTRRGIPS